MKNLQNTFLTVAMAIGLAITGLAPAHASTPSTPVQRETASFSLDASSGDIKASDKARVPFEKPAVHTIAPTPHLPATVEAATVKAVQPIQSESVSTVATTTVVKAAAQAVSPESSPVRVAPKSLPIDHSFSRGAIVAAAMSQLGIQQDCTALVTRSIAAAGINFHGWPAGYLSLGRTVSAAEALPGDLAYYANGGTGMAHIAVYVGNGMAVHGGWEGGTTALYSVNIGSGPVFIRLG